jgi:hypothetical protein
MMAKRNGTLGVRYDGTGEGVQADGDQESLAKHALATKNARDPAPDHPKTEPHSHGGPLSVPRPDYPPSGAFDAEGHRPALERSRKER